MIKFIDFDIFLIVYLYISQKITIFVLDERGYSS